MLKRTFIAVCIASLLVQSGAVAFITVLSIRHQKAEIKAMMKSALKNGMHASELQEFNEHELKQAAWVHSREFILGGNKYDVVRVSGTGSSKIYHCINDVRETALYRSLEKHSKPKPAFEDALKKFCAYAPGPLQDGFKTVLNSENGFGVYSRSYQYQYCILLFRPPPVQV